MSCNPREYHNACLDGIGCSYGHRHPFETCPNEDCARARQPAVPLVASPAPVEDEYRWLREQMREVADAQNATNPVVSNLLRKAAHAMMRLAARPVSLVAPAQECPRCETAKRTAALMLQEREFFAKQIRDIHTILKRVNPMP